ncbi:YfjI family protein [Serratia oryzae]|uniref:YfjI family protein n=1 Tax=Serratia oryzae TaxID=2034155 RepID=UPI0018CE0218|nr:YfjI family protein [Serratia oryzae]
MTQYQPGTISAQSSYFTPPAPDAIPYQRMPLNLLSDAIWSVQNKTKAPLPLVVAAALTPIALICQGLIDVSPAEDLLFPVSCNFCTVAESGERKSTVDKLFMAPIYDYERSASMQYQEDLQLYALNLETWKVEFKALKSQLSKQTKKDQPTDAIKARLIAHQRNEPKPPTRVQLLANDITPAALQYLLHSGGGSLALHSAEGDILLSGQALQNLGLLNDLWDGASFSVTRRQSESFTVHDARLSISLMVQAAVLQKYLKHSMEQARGSGSLARYFFAAPQSTIGTRVGHTMENYQQWVTPYYQRLEQLLMQYTDKLAIGDKSRITLTFTPEAQRYWANLCENIERQLLPDGDYFAIRDFASKESNKVARLAALFHYFSGDEGDIPVHTVEAAQAICQWYLNEALRLFAPAPVPPQHVLDADLLSQWLHERFQDSDGQPMTRSWMRSRVPSALRQPGRLGPALDYLHCNRRVHVWRKGNTTYISPPQSITQSVFTRCDFTQQ